MEFSLTDCDRIVVIKEIELDHILKLKSWKVFLLLIGIPIVASLISASSGPSYRAIAPEYFVFSWTKLARLVIIWPWLAWLWAMGVGINKKIAADIRPQAKLFKICVIFTAIYVPLFMLLLILPLSMSGILIPALLIFPAHLFLMFSIVYMMYFAAKNVVTFEKGTSVKFSDFVPVFIMIWGWPIGVWFVQPRNNVIAQNTT